MHSGPVSSKDNAAIHFVLSPSHRIPFIEHNEYFKENVINGIWRPWEVSHWENTLIKEFQQTNCNHIASCMFKVKDCSFLFLELVSSLVIATSHLLFQISKIVSEPHLIIRWRQCSNDLDLNTLFMDYMFELYTLYYDLCSLLESECLLFQLVSYT